MRQLIPRIVARVFLLTGLLSQTISVSAQETKASAASTTAKQAVPPGKLIEIPVEPTTVDPATLVPPPLARPVTIEFAENSIRDIATWIQTEQKIQVLLDQKALSEDVNLATEQINESLTNLPLYLLLDRLRTLGLEWYMEEGNLHITTIQVASQKLTTRPYNVGDLFDVGFKPEALTETILVTTEGPWTVGDNKTGSGIVLLGDVLFVRQTDRMHREVAGLLAALRKHARQTLTLDAPQNENLRKKLDANVTVSFKDQSLALALQSLAKQAQIDIRLDGVALKSLGIRDRTPVTLVLADQKLSTVLQALLTDLNLTWVLRDGLLWITSQKQAESFMKTAVYSVIDLCRDDSETFALRQAILSQTRGPWSPLQGATAVKDQEHWGAIAFARPGVMVVRQTESGLNEVLQLLENYRTALRASKPRKPTGEDPKEIIIRYYRIPTVMAEELIVALPKLVRPETWNSNEQPKGMGTILKLKSKPSFIDAYGTEVDQPEAATELQHAFAIQNSVLVIQQMREVHASIAELLQKIENGDPLDDSLQFGGGGGGFGGGGQQGGFGGSFFSVPERRSTEKPDGKPDGK